MTAVHHHHAPAPGDVAARVGSQVIRVADVLARERELRAGPFAVRLPVERTPQGRNVLRWIVQLLATEQLVLAEAQRRGLSAGSTPPFLDVASALSLGGVVATVLSTVPVAPAVRDAVTADVEVTPDAVREHYERNLDQFVAPPVRRLDEIFAGVARPWGRATAGQLPAAWEQALAAADLDVPVTVGAGRVFVVRGIDDPGHTSFELVRAELHAQLLRHARDLAFGAWLQRGHQIAVTLGEGFEHPGDPRQADATHRH